MIAHEEILDAFDGLKTEPRFLRIFTWKRERYQELLEKLRITDPNDVGEVARAQGAATELKEELDILDSVSAKGR